jgi:hypothetical protein
MSAGNEGGGTREPAGAYPLFHDLEPPLAPERLAPYLAEAGGDERQAILLYRWGTELSGAVHDALYTFEVFFRNAIDTELCQWNATQRDRSTGRRLGTD